MAKVEGVEVLTTVKAGKQLWRKGEHVFAPVPHELVGELTGNTGTVKQIPKPYQPKSLEAEEPQQEYEQEDGAPGAKRGPGRPPKNKDKAEKE